MRYDWDFGDGNIANDAGPTPEHMYTSSGEFYPTLTITDNSGETATDTTTITVAEGNQLPVADAGEPVAGSSGVAVKFDGSGSQDPDGSIDQYDWNFGDGNTGTGEKPEHTYTSGGDYTVYLAVTDNLGASTSNTTSASIDSANPLAPTAKADGPYTCLLYTSPSPRD